MKKIMFIIGYTISGIFFVLFYLFDKYKLLNDQNDIRFLFPIGAIGAFLLAYGFWLNDKEDEKKYRYSFLITKKGVYFMLILGIVLLFCTFLHY